MTTHDSPFRLVIDAVRDLAGSIVLRNHDFAATLRRGGDIDLLVDDVDAAEQHFVTRLGPPRYVATRSYVRGIYYDWGYIDLFSDCQWRGVVYLSGDLIRQEASAGIPGGGRTRLAHEALTCWLSSLLWGGFFKPRYCEIVCRAAREDAQEFERVLADAVGEKWGRRLFEMALNGHSDASMNSVRIIRRAAKTRALRRHPCQTIWGYLAVLDRRSTVEDRIRRFRGWRYWGRTAVARRASLTALHARCRSDGSTVTTGDPAF